MVVDSTHQSSYRDEKKEDSHSNDSSDDVYAGYETKALSPGSHSNEQQAYQLGETKSKIHLKEFYCAAQLKIMRGGSGGELGQKWRTRLCVNEGEEVISGPGASLGTPIGGHNGWSGVGGGKDSGVWEYKTEHLPSSITSILGETEVHRREGWAFMPQFITATPQTNPLITGSLPSSHGSPQEFPLRRKSPGIFPEPPVHPSPHRKSPRDSSHLPFGPEASPTSKTSPCRPR